MATAFPPDVVEYAKELIERLPDEDERMGWIEEQIEGTSDLSKPFMPENAPDDTDW